MPATGRERLAIRSEDWRHYGVCDSDWTRFLVNESPLNQRPWSLTEMKCAPSGASRMAENPPIPGRMTQDQATTKFELTKSLARGIMLIKCGDRLRTNLNRNRGRAHKTSKTNGVPRREHEQAD